MNVKPKPWRVHVRVSVEEWLEIYAFSPEEAEAIAKTKPNVIHVYGKSAVKGDRRVVGNEPACVVEDEEEFFNREREALRLARLKFIDE